MSLLRKLLASVTLVLTAILLGTLVFSLGSARQYLHEQLDAQARNAAASLALLLSQPANQSLVVQQLLVAAWLDTGKFQSIRVQRLQQEPPNEREPSTVPQAAWVPDWFRVLLPLPAVQAERAIGSAEAPWGHVQVVVSAAHAQAMLWDSSLKMSGWIAGAGLVWALLVTALLRWFQRVLQDEVAPQVLRIGSAGAAPRDARSRQLRELQAVTAAIQVTHRKVQQQEQLQAQRIQALQKEAHSDAGTGLPNRSYFLNALTQALQSVQCGYVLLMRQRDLQAMNASMQRQAVDHWLRGMAEQVQAVLDRSQLQHAQLARINGSDFAVLLPGKLGPSAMHLIEQLRRKLLSLNVALSAESWSRWALALTAFTGRDSAAMVLTRLDQAVMRAESAGHGSVEYADPEIAPGTAVQVSEGQWRQWLTRALQQPRQLRIATRAMGSTSLVRSQKWHEATLELQDDEGQMLDACLFLPAVARLGLSADYDRKALELALEWLRQHPYTDLLLRLSMASLEQAGFEQRICALLAQPQVQPLLRHLILELDAFALEALPEQALDFCAMADKAGVQIGLRRLEQAPRVLLHLCSLRLRHVKVSGFFADLSMHNAGGAQLLGAMLQTAQSQQTAVLITDAVNPETSDWLRAKGAHLTFVQERNNSG